jgi:Recombinase
MEREHAETSLRRRGVQGALANERAADSRARALAASLRKLIAAGFVSQPALAKELNRRKVPTTHGGKWHRTTVARVLARLGVSTNGNINNGLWNKQAADVRAEALRPTIHKLRKSGFISIKAIAAKLNEQGMAASRGGRWHFSTVTRLLQRLEKLDRT